jgi:hypothetical protein
MPSAGLARMRVRAGFGTFERSTTVAPFGAETTTLSSRNDPLTFRLISRRKLKTTSAEVSGVPSEKTTPLRRWKVNSFAPLDAFHEDASHGTGVVPAPLNVTSVSYVA